MKTKRLFLLTPVFFLAVMLLLPASGCKKNSDNNSNNNTTGGTCWGENWLIGTWEGTTPSSVTPFANTKIRIVFDKAELKVSDSMQGNPRRIWAYDGTLTWDAGGSGQWSMPFSANRYPLPDDNIIIYECLTVNAIKQGMANISLRVGDTIQTDPWHSIDLDWGVYSVTTSEPITSFKLYGDVEIETGGNLQRAEYVPDQSEITMMKK